MIKHISLLAIAILGVAAMHAQEPSAALRSLQGRWLVTGGEHDGKSMDAIKGGTMTITGSTFEIRTASGNVLKGSLSADTSTRPFHLDMVHADGKRWEGIYEVDADAFRMNYVEAGGKDRRPAAFTTTPHTEESIVTLRRDSR